jgi:hypothetical protein
MSTSQNSRSAINVMIAGLALTVIAAIIPFLGQPPGRPIAAHIEAGYPGYGPYQVQAAVTIYWIALATVGGLGAVAWLVTIAATRSRKRWATWLATAAFIVGSTVSLFALTVRDTSGDTGLPPAVGWAGLLPCAVGLLAVVLLWMRPPIAKPEVLL